VLFRILLALSCDTPPRSHQASLHSLKTILPFSPFVAALDGQLMRKGFLGRLVVERKQRERKRKRVDLI
jgi:hypothetical protein